MTYPLEVRDEICRRISEGESLRAICSCEGMPSKTIVLRWLANDPDFVIQYTRARELQAEHYLDEIIEISDDSVLDTEIDDQTGAPRTNHDVIARARLRVDTRKWAMSKMAPKKYGDKIQNEHTGPNGGPIITSTMTPEEAYKLLIEGGTTGDSNG